MDNEKLYKEALERARDVYTYYCDDREQLRKIEFIFPELAESEDEKIRKELTEFLEKASGGFLNTTIKCKTFGKWLSWLKKQESVEEIVARCKDSWYNEGKIAGMAEGLSDDEKYQQGWHDALEKQSEQKLIDKEKL